MEGTWKNKEEIEVYGEEGEVECTRGNGGEAMKWGKTGKSYK